MTAKAGYAALVKVGTTSSGSFNAVGYVDSSSLDLSFQELDVSALSSTITSNQLLMGLSQGTGNIKCKYDSADTNGQNVLRTNFLSRTALYFQFLFDTAASAGSQGYKVKAFVSKFSASAAVNGVAECTFSLVASGAPVVDNGNADAA